MGNLGVAVRRAGEAVRCRLRSVRPQWRYVKDDTVAAVPSAIGSIPDGMASAGLIGVSPCTASMRASSGRSSEVWPRARDLTRYVRAFPATDRIGESTRAALSDADEWLVRHDAAGLGSPAPGDDPAALRADDDET